MNSLYDFIEMIISMGQEEFEATYEDMKSVIDSMESNQELINETKRKFILAGLKTEDLIRDKELFFSEIRGKIVDVGSDKKVDLINTLIDFIIKIYDQAIDDNMRISFNVPIEICHPDARVPEYKNEGDAGVDFYLIEDIEIPAHSTIIVKTGLKMAIPMGYELQIRPRSGTSLKTPLRIANAPATIDSCYRDEIGILAWNTSDEILKFSKGDRIAQGVLNEVPKMQFEIVEDITKILGNRNGGFGSTGQ